VVHHSISACSVARAGKSGRAAAKSRARSNGRRASSVVSAFSFSWARASSVAWEFVTGSSSVPILVANLHRSSRRRRSSCAVASCVDMLFIQRGLQGGGGRADRVQADEVGNV